MHLRRPAATGSRIATVALLATLLLLLFPGRAPADEGAVVPVSELLEAAAKFDGSAITVEGELVGDYGFRSDGTMWTQLNDDSYAREALVDGGPRTGSNIGIGVRMPATLGHDLDPAGGYRLEGPLVQVTGTWRYHDPDRGGESYLHVNSLVVVEPGRRIEEGPDWIVFSLGVVLIGAALLMWRRNRRASAAE